MVVGYESRSHLLVVPSELEVARDLVKDDGGLEAVNHCHGVEDVGIGLESQEAYCPVLAILTHVRTLGMRER